LREALKETLAKNVAKNSTDIAETIQHFTDGEILDTFNEDNEGNRHQRNFSPQNCSNMQNNSNNLKVNHSSDDRSDTISLPGERASSRRKLLGDRELMLKKNKLSTQDLSNNSNETKEVGQQEEDFGDGLFDRFSIARKTLNRNSIR